MMSDSDWHLETQFLFGLQEPTGIPIKCGRKRRRILQGNTISYRISGADMHSGKMWKNRCWRHLETQFCFGFQELTCIPVKCGRKVTASCMETQFRIGFQVLTCIPINVGENRCCRCGDGMNSFWISRAKYWKPGQMSKKMGAVNTICFAILGADMHSRQKQFGFPVADVHSIQ